MPASTFWASQIATETYIYAHEGKAVSEAFEDGLSATIQYTVMGLDGMSGSRLFTELTADSPWMPPVMIRVGLFSLKSYNLPCSNAARIFLPSFESGILSI